MIAHMSSHPARTRACVADFRWMMIAALLVTVCYWGLCHFYIAKYLVGEYTHQLAIWLGGVEYLANISTIKGCCPAGVLSARMTVTWSSVLNWGSSLAALSVFTKWLFKCNIICNNSSVCSGVVKLALSYLFTITCLFHKVNFLCFICHWQ